MNRYGIRPGDWPALKVREVHDLIDMYELEQKVGSGG